MRRYRVPRIAEELGPHRLEFRAVGRCIFVAAAADIDAPFREIRRHDNGEAEPGITEKACVRIGEALQIAVDLDAVPGSLDIETAEVLRRSEVRTDTPVRRLLRVKSLSRCIDVLPEARVVGGPRGAEEGESHRLRASAAIHPEGSVIADHAVPADQSRACVDQLTGSRVRVGAAGDGESLG